MVWFLMNYTVYSVWWENKKGTMAFSITGPIFWLLFSMWCVPENKVLSKMPRNAVSLQESTQEHRVLNFTSSSSSCHEQVFNMCVEPMKTAPSTFFKFGNKKPIDILTEIHWTETLRPRLKVNWNSGDRWAASRHVKRSECNFTWRQS